MHIKRNTHIAITLMLGVSSACTTTVPITVSTATPTVPSVRPEPSSTPFAASATPSQTPIPESTATAQFPSNGPYLVFLNIREGNTVLTLISPDAASRKEIPLNGPLDTGYCFSCIISPDGQWLAYWTGYAGDKYSSRWEVDVKPPYDLQLNLLHIPDGSAVPITSLLSPDFPANFDKAKETMLSRPDLFDPIDANGLLSSFVFWIRSAAWSPDSRYLAFAGEMDGPSSDLYVYDLSQHAIRRLSSDPKNLIGFQPIRWSPDGKWILYDSGYGIGEGMTANFYAARPDGSEHREYPERATFMPHFLSESVFWLSDTVFLFSQEDNGTYRLESADLATGRTSMIWKCWYREIAFDPAKSVLLNQNMPLESDADCQNWGLFFRSLPSGNARLVEGLNDREYIVAIEFLGLGDIRYLLTDSGQNTYSISSSGEASLLLSENLFPYIAPDRQWVAFAYEGLRIMDSSGTISDKLSDILIEEEDLLWRPDSKGFLFSSGPDLYHVSLPEMIINKMAGIQYPSGIQNISWQPDSTGYFFSTGSNLYFLSLRDQSMSFVQGIDKRLFFNPVWVAFPE